MKIGIFHATLPAPDRKPGGVEVFVDRLATALCKSGHAIEVISLTPPPPGHLYSHRQIFKSANFLVRRRIGLLFVLPLLLNFARLDDYDVLHLHGSDWFFFNRTAATVRTLHGSALGEARSASNMLRKLSQYLVYPLEHLSRLLATITLAVGPETGRTYRTDNIAKLFAPASVFFPGPKSPTPLFFFVGTWQGRKRGRFVAECFLAQILPRLPGARLIMACDQVPDSNAILRLENPTDMLVAAALRESWALLSASIYEGFGLPYLEAMMSGTAIVTTRNGGATNLLDDGKRGVIVTDDCFAAAVIRIATDTALRARFAAQGLIRAAEYSEDAVVAQHAHWYRMAAARRLSRHCLAV